MANKFTIWINDNVNLTGLSKVAKALGDIKDGAEKMHKSFKEGFEASKKAVDVFFAPLKAVAVPAIAAVTTAFGLLIKSVREFAGQELGERDVTSALIAMGQYTDQYRDQLIKLSDTYQTTTGIADDMWLKSLGQLTRFGMNASNVDRVSEALKNLTGLMDGNLDGATDMIAKAMQGEFGMFSRYGIIIKQTGDQVKDLDAAITAINSKGVGLLEARADTLSGKWTALKNQANEVFEAIGKKISSSLEIGAGIDKAKGLLATLTAAVQSGGLGDLIAKGGKELKEHIEGAVKWAEKIATAIKDSGKPIDVVFADALRAAAKIFVDSLGTLLTASLSIWRAVGIVIFNAFKEEFLALPINAPLRHIEAARNFDNMTPQERQTFADENNSTLIGDKGKVTGFRTSQMSDKEEARFGAKLASSGASDEIATAINDAKVEVKNAFVNLLKDAKTEIETAAGVTKDGKAATPEKSMITITGPDGEEITKSLDEYIAELSKQAEATKTAAEKSTDTATKATDTAEDVKKTSEEATKTLDATKTSTEAVKTALTSLTALHTQLQNSAEQTNQKVASLSGQTLNLAQILNRIDQDVSNIQGQLNSMRA